MKKYLECWLDQHMHEMLQGTIVALPLLAASLAFGLSIMLTCILCLQDTGLYILALTITMIATIISNIGAMIKLRLTFLRLRLDDKK